MPLRTPHPHAASSAKTYSNAPHAGLPKFVRRDLDAHGNNLLWLLNVPTLYSGEFLAHFMPALFPSWPSYPMHGGFMPVSCLIVAFGGLGSAARAIGAGRW